MSPHHFARRRVHLMGIGGAGVSGLVPLLRRAGAEVDGCDLAENETVRRLRDEGVAVAIGHDPAHAVEADLVVHTAAVAADHAELRAARERGAGVMTRAACLAALMQDHAAIAVAGSHGKTTTSWMIGHLLTRAGEDPMVMVGGEVRGNAGSGVRLGASRHFVAEVDESDGGFLHVTPRIAVVTNLEAEHVRHYGSFAGLCAAFHRWLASVPAGGAAVVPETGLPPGVLDGLTLRQVRCGLERGDVRAVDLRLGAEGSDCRVIAEGEDLGPMQVPLPGAHMVLNALMAVAAVRAAGVRVAPAALGDCERVRRRFTVHGAPGGVRVVEDYGHHPTEVAATIAAATLGGGRVQVVFQPHRHTRTADCFDGFLSAFDRAHAVALLPIYAAGEPPLAGVSSRGLAEALAARRGAASALVQHVERVEDAAAFLASHARPGDTCLVLGAGDVNRCVAPLIARLGARR